MNTPTPRVGRVEYNMSYFSDPTPARAMCCDMTCLVHVFDVSITSPRPDVRAALRYVERFLELLIDLLSQLPTRRFSHALVEELHFIVCCELAPLYALTTRVVKSKTEEKKEEDGEVSEDEEEDATVVKSDTDKTVTGPGKLFTQLVEHLRYYMAFEIDDQVRVYDMCVVQRWRCVVRFTVLLGVMCDVDMS